MTPTAKYFNSVARQQGTMESDETRLRHIIECANIHRGDTVLDVGTGTGVLLPALAKAVGPFGNIDAVDIASEMLAVAHEKNAHLPLPVRFMLSDIENDPVHSLYDRIILFNVLPHLQRPMETLMRLYFTNLAGAGSITVAQSRGRGDSYEDAPRTMTLPPASEMATRLTDAGILVDYIEDSPECWAIRMRRR